MSHFQIYLPGQRGQNPQMLAAAGLPDLIAGAEYLDEAQGPDGRGGVIVAWRKPTDHRMGFKPAEQLWLPAVPRGDLQAGRYQVGLWNDRPPTPADLQRPYATKGRFIRFGDGREWLMPEARKLPADMVRADDGSWQFVVQRNYHDFWLESLRWLQWWSSQPTSFVYADVADFVERGLQVNYRLPTELISHLKLFNRDTITDPMFAVLGVLDLAEHVE